MVVEIYLPNYVKHIAKDFSVIVNPIENIDYEDFENNNLEKFNNMSPQIIASDVINNEKFIVYGDKCKFHWMVFAKRLDIDVEPNKEDVIVKGDGPYTYLEKKIKQNNFEPYCCKR